MEWQWPIEDIFPAIMLREATKNLSPESRCSVSNHGPSDYEDKRVKRQNMSEVTVSGFDSHLSQHSIRKPLLNFGPTFN
jgi:hypothetical protein